MEIEVSRERTTAQIFSATDKIGSPLRANAFAVAETLLRQAPLPTVVNEFTAAGTYGRRHSKSFTKINKRKNDHTGWIRATMDLDPTAAVAWIHCGSSPAALPEGVGRRKGREHADGSSPQSPRHTCPTPHRAHRRAALLDRVPPPPDRVWPLASAEPRESRPQLEIAEDPSPLICKCVSEGRDPLGS